MFRASVNEKETFTIDFNDSEHPILNGELFSWNFIRLTDRLFHILQENRSYSAELLSIDAIEKVVTLKINQSVYRVKAKDRFDLLLEQMGISSSKSMRVNDIKAPMPGLILSVEVQPGEVIRKGDTVLILEAMKMENVIKAPGDGTVKAVRVSKGISVEKNQILVEFL